MNLTELAVISELIGAIAVVISLIYLTRQVRQNTHAVRAANANTVQKNFIELAQSLLDRDISAIVLKGMSKSEPLTGPEQLSAYAWFFSMLKMAELAHFHYRNGDLDPELWKASLEFYLAYFTTPGMRDYWEKRRSAFVPEFVRAMDGWLAHESQLQRPDRLVASAVTRSAQDGTVEAQN